MPFGSAFRRAVAAAVREGIERGEYPGAVVLVRVAGRTAYRGAFGDAQREPVRVPMRPDTIFDLASLTKPLATGSLLARLVDRGVLSLRDPAARWCPEFREGGKDRVTLLDLATHSGGLDDAGLYDPAAPMVSTAAARELLRAKTLFAPPGTAYRYADLNFIALGWVVEAAAGAPLDRAFAVEVARPLRMRAAGFNPPPARRRRCAATERRADRGGEPRVLRGEVHDPRAWDLGGVAGHAGLFGTADDVAAVPEALLADGRAGRRRWLSPAAAALFRRVLSPAGLRPRGLGWDTDPDGTGPRGDLFPADGFGHTGFTGTSVWCDPASRTVVVVLTNRVHPAGRGTADSLRRRIANLAAAEVARRRGARAAPAVARRRPAAVLTGVDVLAADGFAALAGRRVGLLANRAAVDRRGEPVLDVLARAPGVTLAALFSPEHGLEAAVETRVPSSVHPRLGIPVYSLYGETERPASGWLAGLDALVVDLPDVGARFYTYHATLGYSLEACAAAGVPVIVLDRPNPVTGDRVEGPLLPASRRGFTGYAVLPVRHGLTLGELGRLIADERGVPPPEVVRVRGWERARWFDETGLPWANPSPNLRTLTQAMLYIAAGLLEATNLSVGRGTDTPFEHVGAPWLDGGRVAAEANAAAPPGLRFYPAAFTPSAGPHAGERCGAVRLLLVDRDAFRPVLAGIALAAAIRRVHGEAFDLPGLDRMLVHPASREAIDRFVPPDEIAAGWAEDEEAFRRRRRAVLLY